MTAKRVLLHIGRHKTGTSSLQRFLFEKSERLHAEGIHYPRELVSQGFAHHGLATPLARRHFRGNARGQLAAARSRARNSLCELIPTSVNVLSSEAFQNCDPRLVAEVFAGWQVGVVVYLRNQLDYLASAYAQRIHATNYTGTLEEFAVGFDMDYARFLASWASYFPLRPRLFASCRMRGGDVVADFVTEVLERPGLLVNYRRIDQNPSLSRRIVAFKQALNWREHLTADRLRSMYPVLAAMAETDTSGPFRISPSLKARYCRPLAENQRRWAKPFFGVTRVFQYADTKTSATYVLKEEEYQYLKAELERRLSCEPCAVARGFDALAR